VQVIEVAVLLKKIDIVEYTMQTDSIVSGCRKCGTKNRIPCSRLSDKVFCGRCHSPLIVQYDDHPIIVNDANFHSEVLNSSLPVLVDFWASWCGPCRMMSPIIDRIAKKYAARIKVAKVNVDDNPRSASQYGIRSIPSLLMFLNGSVADTIIGSRSQENLEMQISKFILP